ELARRHGVHLTSAVSLRVPDAAPAMAALRADPPPTLAGSAVVVADLLERAGHDSTDAVVLSAVRGEAELRMTVRPSGTEPKLKFYLEVSCAPAEDLEAARASADELRGALVAAAHQLGARLI